MAPLAEVFAARAAAAGSAGEVAAVVREAIASPALFVFGELIDVPAVKELQNGEHKALYDLLQIFAFETYRAYTERKAHLPELSAAEVRKLQLLSVVSIAGVERFMSYELLEGALGVEDVRQVEDIVIDAITNRLLSARIDQAARRVEVLDAAGRDTRSGDVEAMIAALQDWEKRTSDTIAELDAMIAKSRAVDDERVRQEVLLEKQMVEATH